VHEGVSPASFPAKVRHGTVPVALPRRSLSELACALQLSFVSETPSIKRAFLWSAIDRFGQMGLQFIMGIVMARLLTPSDFGLVGMLAVFFGVALVIEDGGFGSALIQRKEITAEDKTSVFWLNVSSGVVLTLLLCAISPAVAVFFRQPVLKLLLCALSLQLFIQSFSLVQVALLARKLDFRTAAIVNTWATLVSGGIGIGSAVMGCGVWSLVFQKLSSSLFRTTGFWLLAPWRPRGRFSSRSIRSLWTYSSNLLASGLLDSVFTNIYNAIFGRLGTVQTVGQFTTANQLQQGGAAMTTSVIGSVMFSQFSRHQENKEELKTQFRRTVRILACFHFPMMAGLSACAHTLVLCLFAEKWEGSVPFLRILSFVGMLYPLHALHLSVLKAQGRSDLHFRLEMIKIGMVLLMLTLTWQLGIMAITLGILIHSVLALAVNGYYTRRLLCYNWLEQVADLMPACGVSLLAVLPAALADQWTGSMPWSRLTGQIFVIIAVYGIAVLLLRNSVLSDAAATMRVLWKHVRGRVHWIWAITLPTKT